MNSLDALAEAIRSEREHRERWRADAWEIEKSVHGCVARHNASVQGLLGYQFELIVRPEMRGRALAVALTMAERTGDEPDDERIILAVKFPKEYEHLDETTVETPDGYEYSYGAADLDQLIMLRLPGAILDLYPEALT